MHCSFKLTHQFNARRWDSNLAPSPSVFFVAEKVICPFSFVIGGSTNGVVMDCIFEN